MFEVLRVHVTRSSYDYLHTCAVLIIPCRSSTSFTGRPYSVTGVGAEYRILYRVFLPIGSRLPCVIGEFIDIAEIVIQDL
jgi:hypothetical protein